MGFGDRLKKAMELKKWSQADLCRATNYESGVVSQYINKPERDPRLSTALTFANALDLSLDYLAGRTDNPMGFCDEELEDLYIDARARELLRGFELLTPEGKDAIQDQVDFQLSKSRDAPAPARAGAASAEVA